MKRRRLLLIAGAFAACVVTLCVLALLPPHKGVTKANFDRIQKGMTTAEVEQIFGEKGVETPTVNLGFRIMARDLIATDFSTVLFERNATCDQPLPMVERFALTSSTVIPWPLSWHADDKSVATIDFEGDRVMAMTWTDSMETIPQKLRRWLRLP